MKINKLVIAGIMSVGLLASCSNDDSAPSNQAKKAVVSLSLSSGATRVYDNLPATDGSVIGMDEGSISRLAVCYFSKTGKIIKIFPYEKADLGDFKTPLKEDVTTDADSMYVIANFPKGKISADITTIDDVRKVVYDLANTTYDEATGKTQETTLNSQNTGHLLMFSKLATGLSLSNTAVSVTANLERTVARICLNSLTQSLADTKANFVPTEVFMYNVSNNLTLPKLESTSIVNGEYTDANTSTPGVLNASSQNAYLSSGYINFASNPTYFSKPTYFYVFPGEDVAFEVKGLYTDASNVTTVKYYKIIVNHIDKGDVTSTINGTNTPYKGRDAIVDPNIAYNLSLKIVGEGSKTPDTSVPGTVQVSLTVAPWTTVNQNTQL